MKGLRSLHLGRAGSGVPRIRVLQPARRRVRLPDPQERAGSDLQLHLHLLLPFLLLLLLHVAWATRAWPTESLKGLETGRRTTLRQTLGRVSGVFVFVLSLFGLCSQTGLFKFLNIFLIRWLFLFLGEG